MHPHGGPRPDPEADGAGDDPETVDRLVDDVLAGRGRPGDGEGAVEALARVRAAMSEPLPRSSRRRHLAAIRSAGGTARWAGIQRRFAPIAASAAALVILAGGGTVALAQDAGPDDALYGVKIASEQVWVTVPRGSERSAQVQIALAERRLDEARGAPHRAESLVDASIQSIDAAAEDDPAEAIAAFERLLGGGEGALPAEASPRARQALARNCHRIAERHGVAHSCPEPDPSWEHPGRGRGQGQGRGLGPDDGPRGWGPGGRPAGEVGPPPGLPGQDRDGTDG